MSRAHRGTGWPPHHYPDPAPRDAHGRFRARPIAHVLHALMPPIGWMVVGAVLALAATRGML
jgi:hypothetical protein